MSTEALAAARGRLLNAAARRIPAASAASQARALGLWDGKEVRFANEAQFGLLLDLGVFGPVGGHSRALEREERQPHDEEEKRVLDALAAAHFTLFRLSGAHPEGGVRADDLLRGTELRIRDDLLQRPEFEGCGFAGRLMRLDGVEMTCGATAPLSDEVIEAILDRAAKVVPTPPTLPPLTPLVPEDVAALRRAAAAPDFPARVYRASLDAGLLGKRPD